MSLFPHFAGDLNLAFKAGLLKQEQEAYQFKI
jgi:hypothetical protein